MRRLLCSLVVGASLAFALPVPAQAASVRVTDTRRDVQTVTVREDGTYTQVRSPGSDPDVTAVRLTHSRTTVSLRLAFVDLVKPTGDDFVIAQIKVRGGNGQVRDVQVGGNEDYPYGRLSTMTRPNSDQRLCTQGLKARLDYSADLVTVGFPRRCLGSPGRVRASVIAAVIPPPPAEGDHVYRFDDALRNGGSVATVGSHYTRWVARG